MPGEIAASVLVLQTLQDLSARDAVAAVHCDIRWKVACGLPLTMRGSSHDVDLLAPPAGEVGSSESDFEAVRAVIAETGVLHGKTRRALDSVVLDDAVVTQDT